MASFDVRSTLRATGLIALAVAGHSATSAQPNAAFTAEDATQKLVATIDEIESRQGDDSPELIEPLTALSLLYEERGDQELALALIEETTQVVEVNYGLHTLDEALLMRQAIRIERARGSAEAAWDREQEMLRLIRRRRHQADARTVPILREIADHRRAILARYRAGEFPPEIVLGCYYSEIAYDAYGNLHRTGCRSGDRDTVIVALRSEAENFESEAEAVAGRIERWIELPCRKPAAPTTVERRSGQPSKEAMQTYFRAVSDYAGCTQAKYEYAARAEAPAEQVAALASERDAAADELTAQAALYNERFHSSRKIDRSKRRPSAEGS